ncbi:MAG: zinc ABC transporter substrate-binding protein [Treponema sp.]|jgi:zinc transport system substrate-binding protein|nr:zinc ABC transporter substrate-binding protein [Treponema sp.]
MKRIVFFIGVLLSLTVVLSARGQRDTKREEGKLQVVTTIFPPYDFVREIAGDKVSLTMLLPPGAESHSFEPTPRDIITVQNCDVFIYGGGESDTWVDGILESMDTSRMSIISLMECVDVVEEEIVEGMQEEEEEGHDHGHGGEDFEDAEVKDRSLAEWAGEWQSTYPLLLNRTLDPVLKHKAAEDEKQTVEDFRRYYDAAYKTDAEKVIIDRESITYYTKGVSNRVRYTYKGFKILLNRSGAKRVRYLFEAEGNPGSAPRYVQFSDHLIKPGEGIEYFHLYQGNVSNEALFEEWDHWPTYYLAAFTGEEIVQELTGHDHEAEAEYDEHVWTAPRNVKLIVQKISEVLKQRDGANRAVYESTTRAYLAKLTELDHAFQQVIDGAKRKTLIFGDRFPFRYFADAYGLQYFAAFPGCSTETEASAATIAFLINKIRAERLPVVFHIELSNEKIADILCEETGAKKLLLHAVHNVSKRDFDNGASYYGLMTQNIRNLQEALY